MWNDRLHTDRRTDLTSQLCVHFTSEQRTYINSQTNNISVGFHVLIAAVVKNTMFWVSTPFSPLKVSQRFGGTYHLYFQGRNISRTRNQRESRCQSSILKIEATYSYETSVDFQRTTRLHIPEDRTFQRISTGSSPFLGVCGVCVGDIQHRLCDDLLWHNQFHISHRHWLIGETDRSRSSGLLRISVAPGSPYRPAHMGSHSGR
jgi:hypothetical protein